MATLILPTLYLFLYHFAGSFITPHQQEQQSTETACILRLLSFWTHWPPNQHLVKLKYLKPASYFLWRWCKTLCAWLIGQRESRPKHLFFCLLPKCINNEIIIRFKKNKNNIKARTTQYICFTVFKYRNNRKVSTKNCHVWICLNGYLLILPVTPLFKYPSVHHGLQIPCFHVVRCRFIWLQ